MNESKYYDTQDALRKILRKLYKTGSQIGLSNDNIYEGVQNILTEIEYQK